MDRRRVSRILIGLGLVLVAVGAVLWATDGDDATVAADAGVGDTTTTAATTDATTSSVSTSTTSTMSTTTTTSTTTTSTVAPVATETPEEFFAILKGALDGGDAAVLFERMNQATVDRYGADQCRAYAESVAGAGFDASLRSTSDLATWDYTTDEVTTSLDDVVAAEIDRTINGQTMPQTTHWQLVDGRHTWFTDCGSPV